MILFFLAAIQWIPDHKRLMINLLNILKENGVLAVQVPNTSYMPIRVAIKNTAREDKWQEYFNNMDNDVYYEELDFYYNVLISEVKEIELWETRYNHVLPGYKAVIEWYSSTGMRPYLEKLDEREQKEFTESILTKISSEYKLQKDDKILFPFRRLFFIAYK